KKCKILVAYGTCACFGSITSMANLYSMEDLKQRKFVEQPTYDEGSTVPTENVPEFVERAKTVEMVVPIDAKMPGCPPTSTNILGAINWVLNNTAFDAPSDRCACDACTIRESCLLNDGNLCMGFLTADPGKGITPDKYSPVLGEYGKTTAPGLVEAEKLAGVLAAGPLSKELVEKLNEFYMLWTGLGNFGMITLGPDILFKLLLDENAFPLTEATVGAVGPVPAYQVEVPGMPEIVNLLVGAALYAMVKSGNLKFRDASVCDQCDRKRTDALEVPFKRDFEGLPDPKICFLKQGYYCMGPIARAGCSGLCPNNGNAPCAGCFGPTFEYKDLGAKYEEAFSKMMGVSRAELYDVYKDAHGMMYRFTTASKKEGE
ncbi:MAG TPA: hypothetical protein VKK79_02555, partial [Candidatus Lokiarchaeia archaeon]|nr:hypothetical protein [Candidatus Lokiarchaeia archaeon]